MPHTQEFEYISIIWGNYPIIAELALQDFTQTLKSNMVNLSQPPKF
jgi:hypothetical protein